jgi:indole-3-glycerol phosphate synthase
VLADLFAGSRADAEERLETLSINDLEKRVLAAKPALDAIGALVPSSQIKIIAEIKRASPSKGVLAEISNPEELAVTYEEGGASAISVLTEQRKFKGSLEDLGSVRKAVSLPLLRKDFISTKHQILEARAYGADIILLIVAGLKEDELISLGEFAKDLGMTPFYETHSKEELKIAAGLGARLIGVNARDLVTFETDRDLFSRLYDQIPSDAIKVAESAVRDASDVNRYRDAGADVVLVGEALVTSDPAETLRSFLPAART